MAHRPRGARTPPAVSTLVFLVSVSLSLATTVDAPARTTAPWSPSQSLRGKLLQEKAGPLRSPRLKLSQEAALGGHKAPDSLVVLVVGCDFSDSLMWGRDLDDFPGWPPQRRTGHINFGTESFQFAAHDSVYFDIQMRKVADYFATVSFGQFSLGWSVHPEIVNLPRPMGYYGEADSSDVRVVEMTQAILDAIDPDVDFTPFDTVVIIHAGAGRETDILGDSPEQIYSNYLDRRDFEKAAETGHLDQPWLRTDEGQVEHVLILPESESQDPFAGSSGFFGTRGVYCFEFGLRLGMLNLADFTPSPRPDSQGIGNFGLMAYGLFTGLGMVPAAPCAMNRMLMGWAEVVETSDEAHLRLGAMDETGRAVADTLLVRVPINNREYLLLEYRLQDPNGDLFYTFDDLNGNRVPDFFDADSEFGDGFPTSPFDPAEDQWESTSGSEWDFFMTETSPRSADRCQRGGGSGLYIWHVDERVIESAVVAGTNTINADPRRKGVDLEEADGIQDLDSGIPTRYFLGWDQDVWRGEGAARFGPDTVPSSETADGLATGIVVDEVGKVVADTLARDGEGNCTGFVYRPAISLRVTFEPPVVAASLQAQVRLDEHPASGDVRLVDLGRIAGDPTPDGRPEIVQSGDDGRVYAFHGDLSDWLDGDGDPSTPGVLAVAGAPGARPIWSGPPAVGDLDADGAPDVVLASRSGVYAFSSLDGAGLGDDGLLWALDPVGEGEELVGSPVLLGRDAATLEESAEPPYEAWQVAQRFEGELPVVVLARVGTFDAGTQRLAPGRALGGAALLDHPDGLVLAIPWRDEESAGLILVLTADPSRGSGLRVEGGISEQPLLSYEFLPGGPAIAWVDTTGAPRATVAPAIEGPLTAPERWTLAATRVGASRPGPWSPLVGGPLRAGGEPMLARAAGSSLVALDRSLGPRDGFPHAPLFVADQPRGASSQPGGLLADLDTDGTAEVIWHDPVGRVHAVDSAGAPLPGWPLAGPAEPAGSPALADLDGDGDLDLVTAGAFATLVRIDAPNRTVISRRRGEIRIFDLPTRADARVSWAQGRGDVRNTGRQPADSENAGIAAQGPVLDPGSLIIHPNPATSDRVRVRVRLRRSSAVVVSLHNLEGQEVARVGPIDAVGGAHVDQTISIAGLASGFYLCRVSAGDELQVLPFTVAR